MCVPPKCGAAARLHFYRKESVSHHCDPEPDQSRAPRSAPLRKRRTTLGSGAEVGKPGSRGLCFRRAALSFAVTVSVTAAGVGD